MADWQDLERELWRKVARLTQYNSPYICFDARMKLIENLQIDVAEVREARRVWERSTNMETE